MKLDYIKDRERDLAPEDYHIYVDLDGVMADLRSYVNRVLGYEVRERDDGDWVNSKEIWKTLRAKREPNFDQLDKLPDADKLWNYIRQYRPNILTATGHPVDKNDAQKRDWVKKNLTGYKDIFTVVTSRNKAKFAWPDAILIDDRMKSIRPWREAGGIGILHRNANDTIKQLQKLGL